MPNTHDRSPQNEIFFLKLLELTKFGKEAVSNNRIKDELGWDEKTYNKVKNYHIDGRKVRTSQGRGGLLNVTYQPAETFISYAHEDKSIMESLATHLSPLHRLGLIRLWHDKKLNAGAVLDKEIAGKLNNAEVVIMLVSADFINSDYCFSREMIAALENHRKNKTKIIPILARSCYWQLSPFSSLLLANTKAIASHENQDEALVSVVEEIKKVLDARNT